MKLKKWTRTLNVIVIDKIKEQHFMIPFLASLFILVAFCLPRYALIPQFARSSLEEKIAVAFVEFMITFGSWFLFRAYGVYECMLFAFFFVLEIVPYLLINSPVGPYEYLQITLTPAVCTLLLIISAQRNVSRRRAIGALIWFFIGFILLAQFINWAYLLKYGVPLSKNALVTLWGSDLLEAWAYFRSQWGYKALSVFLLALSAFFYGVAQTRKKFSRQRNLTVLFSIFSLSLILVAGYRSKGDYYIDTLPDLISSFLEYRSTVADFRAFREVRRSLVQKKISARKNERGEIYVFVIGESVCRDFMGRYGYKWPTTPWLSDERYSHNIVVLENAYSCMCHTEQALSLALTAYNNYSADKALHMRKALTSDSVIQVLNDAGFETYWLSNQIKIGGWDNIVSSLASDAQNVLFLDHQVGRVLSKHRDEALLPPLKDILAKATTGKNVAVFIHLKGSHAPYGCSVADSWIWKAPFVKSPDYKPVNFEYDKTIAYTDDLLRRLTEWLTQSSFSAACLFYFSDHGEAVTSDRMHNYDLLEPEMVRIPAFFWFSEGYAARYSETVKGLFANRKKIFTNDLFFDALIDLAHIEYDGTPTSLRITRHEYKIDAHNARFWNGRLLKEIDPQLIQSGDDKK